MADRILRADLLTSEAWLCLKNNDDRACWIALFLSADTLGNQPAGPHRLVHLWRPYGIDTTEKAARVQSELADVDLARPYQIDGKPYIHLPRFRQSRRFLGRLSPPPPWATDEEKQLFASKSRVNHSSPPVNHESPPSGVGVGVGVGVLEKRTSAPGPIKLSTALAAVPTAPTEAANPTSWADYWTAKGKALGIEANPGEATGDYCRRVMTRVKGA